jgi:hypothetical protein
MAAKEVSDARKLINSWFRLEARGGPPADAREGAYNPLPLEANRPGEQPRASLWSYIEGYMCDSY